MSDVYKIGMEIALTGGLSHALAGIMGQLTGMHGKVKEIEKGLHNWNAAIIGVGAIAVGAGILEMAGHVEKAGEKLAHAKEMLSLGKSPLDMARLTSAAWKETGKNLRTDIVGNVEALQDLYNVLMNTDHAITGLHGFNIMKNALDSASGKGVEVGDAASARNIGDAIRAFELEGITSEAGLSHASEEFTKAILALPGRINGTAYNTQVANAGSSRMGWDDDFKFAGVPALMNILKGKTGTSLNALGNNIADGLSSSLLQMEQQIKFGLQQDANRMDPEKKKPGFNPGTAFEAAKLRADPIAWSTDYLALLKSQGVDIADKNEMMTVVASVARGNKLLKSALDELLLPASHAQILKEYQRIGGMPGGMVADINSKDPEAVRAALYKQFDTAVQGFGEQLSIALIPALQEATKILQDLNAFIGAHPIRTRIIADGVAVSGMLLTLAGTLAVLRGVLVFSGLASIARVGAAAAGGAAGSGATATTVMAGASALARIGAAIGAGGAASFTGGVVGLLGLLSLTNPNRQDPLSHIGGGAQIWESARRAQAALNQGADMEAHRGAALGKLMLPPPVVNVKATVNVTLDGASIAAHVETRIVKDTRAVSGASDSDGSAAWHPPDMMGP